MSANALTNLNHTLIAQQILEEFVALVTPIMAFARNFSDETVKRGDKVKVLYVKAAEAAKDFAGTYEIQGSEAEGLDIAIDKRKYVSWGLTSEDIATKPLLEMERFVKQKAFQLAKAFLQDVLSLATAANFGAEILSSTAGNFDADDVADMEATLDDADWPGSMRALLLKPTYYSALVKDAAVQGDLGVESEVMTNSRIKRLHNFDLYKCPLLPANGENLRGLVLHPDAILVANRVLKPEGQAAVAAARAGVEIEVITHAESGLSMVLKDLYLPLQDTHSKILEINYGCLPGNEDACKRIITP